MPSEIQPKYYKSKWGKGKRYYRRYNWNKSYNVSQGRGLRTYLYTPRYRLMPKRMWYKASWNGSFDYTAATTSSQQCRLTSPYDPDFTGTGTSAAGFAQMAALYNQHSVYKVDIKLDFINKDDTPIVATMNCYPAGFDAATRTEARDQNFSDSILVPSTAGGGVITKNYTVNPPDIAGVSTPYFIQRPEYAATATGNPNRGVLMEVLAAPADGATTSYTVIISLVFHIVAWESLSTTQA